MGNVSSKSLPDNNTFPSTPSSSFSTTPAAGVPPSTTSAVSSASFSSASLSSSTADSPSKDTEKTTVAKAHRSSVSFSPSTFSSLSSSSTAPPSTRLVPPPTFHFTLQPNNDSDNQTRNNNIHIHSGNDNDLASVVKSPHSIEPTTSSTSINNPSNTPMPSPTPASLLDKPLPASPASASASLLLSPSTFLDQETVKPRRSDSLNAHQRPGLSSPGSRISGRVNSLSQQSMHSQSSLSGRSIASSSSGSSSGHGSGTSGSGSATRSHNSSANTVTTRTTSISGGTTESVGQLSLQRFPTGESEYKTRPVSGSSSSTGHGLGAQTKASRTTSIVSTSSARSSSGSSGFKFSFKPLLYSHGNDSKQHQHLYHHHNGSSPATSSNGHRQALDPFANSPFPSILMSIRLPQSLLDKYVIDQESFRQGKGVWGIGKYSWTITVLSRANGKKYVIKRVSKSLLPPSAYYHYPTTAHRLCTCPACKSLREQLLLTGQLPDNELENLQEVLVIHNKGRRKELPQLPPSSPQQSRQHQPQRPLSASSIASPTSSSNNAKESKEKQRRSFNLYSCHNASTPNHTSKFSAFSPITSPQDTPVNSRPPTPVPSPLRILSTPPPPPPPLSSTHTSSSPLPTLPVDHGKIHNSNNSNSITNKSQTAQSSLTPSLLLPAETPLIWSQTGDSMVSQGPRDLSRHNQQQDAPRGPGIPPQSAGTPSSSLQARPTLQRHASTPNMSRAITGLDVLEMDPAQVDQLRRLSRLGNHGGGNGGGVISFGRDRDHHRDIDSRLDPLKGDRPPSDSPLSMTMTMQALHESTLADEHYLDTDDDGREANVEYEKTPTTMTHSAHYLQASMVTTERNVSPFDTNDGEFKQMEPESPESSTAQARNGATSAPLMFTPPPHALPMELVLLQTYNDSDHLPEHHEWTQDEDHWYYVTKAHGVRRRKLKKVSSWWLDLSSLGGALLSAGSSSSHEPIATGPIYNMGRAPGTTSTTPHPSSPLSSELALGSPSLTATDTTRRTHAAKESISSMASQETVNPNSAAFKRQSSPRSSTSLMGKYYYVDWDEYLSL